MRSASQPCSLRHGEQLIDHRCSERMDRDRPTGTGRVRLARHPYRARVSAAPADLSREAASQRSPTLSALCKIKD